MESSLPADASPAESLHSLASIAKFLHGEGESGSGRAASHLEALQEQEHGCSLLASIMRAQLRYEGSISTALLLLSALCVYGGLTLRHTDPHPPLLAGFYAAEAALLREIEMRFPASVSRRPSSNVSEAEWTAATAAAPPPSAHACEPVVLLAEPVR
jgi:hypothetical protein